MVEKRAELKVAGGKLLRAKLIVEDSVVKDAVITGDFFLHPEEGLELLEAEIRGLTHPVSVDELTACIEKVKGANDLTFIGFSSRELAEVIWSALK